MLGTVCFLVCFALKGHGGWTAIWEWTVVLYQLNFFSIVSQENAFYQTVHEPGTLNKKQ
jgi:hypothetical protein